MVVSKANLPKQRLPKDKPLTIRYFKDPMRKSINGENIRCGYRWINSWIRSKFRYRPYLTAADMFNQSVRRSLQIIWLMMFMSLVVFSQPPKIKFYPFGKLTLCKGCGHAHTDYWRLKYRLENVSGSDLIVYGMQLGDDVDFIHEVQYRNPHLCEWQYGNGETERRVRWSDLPTHEKTKIYLKAGESIESERGIGGYAWGGSIDAPARWVTWITASSDVEPYEVFSDPIIEVNGTNINRSEELSYRVVDAFCTPQCRLNDDQSPTIQGIRLGMTLSEFQKQFPNVKISPMHDGLHNIKMGFLWDFKIDAYDLVISFLDDKVATIEAHFRSLKNARSRDDFYRLISNKIGIPYWPPYQLGWECKGLMIEVIPNLDPTIIIQTKEYIKARDRLNELNLKKLR